MPQYRIRRHNTKNITIQRKRNTVDGSEQWATISYNGNSAKSLVSGLFDVLMSQHTPQDAELLQQLKTLELAVNEGIGKLEKMINDNKAMF